MHLKILACDLDGTLAEQGRVAAATWDYLRQAREAGLTLMLVTGRRLETFAAEGPFAEVFEAIIAENGAAIYFPRNDSVILPFGRVEPNVVRRLEALDIPLERGIAIVATWVPHDEAVLTVLRDMGGSATMDYNKGAVMVLPPGATKGTGLQTALHELGYSLRNVVACGDAENDRSLFEVSELSVAVANATPGISALADITLEAENGAGVRALIDMLLERKLPEHEPRQARRLMLGYQADGALTYLNSLTLLGRNLGIVGASGSGKSWLAGLLAEELLRHGYQVCVIDPEGDYRGLQAFPHTLLLGGSQTSLPSAHEIITLSEYTNVSLIIDLSGHPLNERLDYVEELIRGLFALRARRGRPHWFLVDEMHSFCPHDGSGLTEAFVHGAQGGGLAAISYQPSWIAPELLQTLNLWLLLRLSDAADFDVLSQTSKLLQDGDFNASHLTRLPLGQAYLCCRTSPNNGELTPELINVRPTRRIVPHVRHLHKYLKAPLPASKRFYFRDADHSSPSRTAASLWEFREALQLVPLESLRYHLKRGDFERWLIGVLHESELARRIRKLARRPLEGEGLRAALKTTVAHRYEELESLI